MNIEKIIYNWVAEHYGQNEADDPSWCIESLAQEIKNKLKQKD